MSINFQILQKRGVLPLFFLFLVGSAGFAIGYLYAREQHPAPIIIQKIEACEKN